MFRLVPLLLNKRKLVPDFFILLKISYFMGNFLEIIYVAALGLGCCTQAFSSCSEQGLLLSCGSCGVRASHCSGLSHCGARALGHVDSVVVAHGLSWSVARGIFQDWESKPVSPVWQADS